MKVLFLAAGKSERLKPLTRDKTKTLLDIGGRNILDHSLEALTSKGFKDFAFISGHGSDHLKLELKKQSKKHKFIYKVIYNKMYESMNNCYSVLLALKHLNESFLLVNSDVVYDPNILDKVRNLKETSLVVDDYKKLTPESMKVYVKDGRTTHINKKLNIGKSFGEYIGISLIVKRHLSELKKSLEKVVKEDPNQYYEDGYARMFETVPFKIISTEGKKWVEVDDFADLKKAQYLLRKKFV